MKILKEKVASVCIVTFETACILLLEHHPRMPILQPGLCPSLTEDLVNQLAARGIKSVLDFICSDNEKNLAVVNVPYRTLMGIRRYLLAQYSAFPINGKSHYEKTVATLSILPAGDQSHCMSIVSGINTAEVTEFRGPSSSGKTQLCVSTAVEIALSLKQNVIYIDTTCEFSTSKAVQLLKDRIGEGTYNETLSKIRICQCTSSQQLLDILTCLRNNLSSQNDQFYSSLKVIFIDSISAVLYPDIQKANFVEGQSTLSEIGQELNAIAKDFNIAVVTTNDTPPRSSLTWSEKKNALGHFWNYVPSCKYYMKDPEWSDIFPRPL